VNRHLLLWLAPLAILIPAILVVLMFAKPATPKVMYLFAGLEGSSYYQYAQKYADFLGDRGIEVRIQETAGSIENLRSLAQEERPAAAFALSGVDSRLQSVPGLEDLESLGCLSLQPFWLFVRAGSEVTSTQDLTGLRVAIGQSETDTRAIATLALAANGMRHKIVESEVSEQTPLGMADALIEGEVDAVFLVGMPRSEGVSALLESDLVEPVSFRRIDAYSRLHPEVGNVVIPEGLYDLATNIPSTDLHLVSPADNLVIRSDLHPAMVDLLLDAARIIHREPTLFGDRGTFPNMRYTSLPLSETAVRFYEQGPPAWRKYLPYWLATLISRFALIVAQVSAVVLLILKGIPALLKLRFNLKITALYKRMEIVERDLMAGAVWDETMAELRAIQDDVSALKVPRFALVSYLELRQNVLDLRERTALWHQEHPAS